MRPILVATSRADMSTPSPHQGDSHAKAAKDIVKAAEKFRMTPSKACSKIDTYSCCIWHHVASQFAEKEGHDAFVQIDMRCGVGANLLLWKSVAK